MTDTNAIIDATKQLAADRKQEHDQLVKEKANLKKQRDDAAKLVTLADARLIEIDRQITSLAA